jgi:phage baseplate assembly protein W
VSTARYRAWRFVFPELQQEEQISGLGLTARGGAAMVDEADSVRQAILLLLATRPGERVMRPDYGCDLFKLVFAPGDNTTAGLAMHYVREALARWEPRIDIAELDANVDPEHPGRLDIVLQYRLRMTRQWDQAALALNLHTGGLS